MGMIKIQRGVPVTIPIQFLLNDLKTPYPLTGTTLTFAVKARNDKTTNDDTALIKKTITVHVNDVNGETQIVLTGTDTDIAENTYKADLKWTMAGVSVNTDIFYIKVVNVVTQT